MRELYDRCVLCRAKQQSNRDIVWLLFNFLSTIITNRICLPVSRDCISVARRIRIRTRKRLRGRPKPRRKRVAVVEVRTFAFIRTTSSRRVRFACERDKQQAIGAAKFPQNKQKSKETFF